MSPAIAFDPVVIQRRKFVPMVITNKWRRFRHSFEVEKWRAARVPYVPRDGDPVDLKIYPGGMPRGWNPLYFPRHLPMYGLPDVITPHYDDFMPFNRAWQNWHFELLKLSAAGSMNELQLKAAFIPIFDRGRFLLNDHSWDSKSSMDYPYMDFINNRHLSGVMPRFESLGMGGNVVKELGRVSFGKEWHVIVESMDGRANPPAGMTWKTHPHLVFRAVSETISGGRNVVNDFPQLQGAPVYYAFASTYKNGSQPIQMVRESWLIND